MCTNQPERVSALLSQLKRTSDNFDAGMANAAPPTPVSSTPLSPAAAGAGGGPSTSLPSRFYVTWHLHLKARRRAAYFACDL